MDLGNQHGRVGVVNFTRLERSPNGRKLVAGRKHGYTRLFEDHDLVFPEHGQKSSLLGTHAHASF